jgi:outer membrane protein OmpA-like peptidoglycan-associated protein
MHFIKCLFLFAFMTSFAPEDEVKHAVYFDFDRFEIKKVQQNTLYEFTKSIDTTRVESVQIFDNWDDRGKNNYNFNLSTERAHTMKDSLFYNGIKNIIIISIDGKGNILNDKNLESYISEARSKKKSVDVLVKFKPLDKKTKPSSFTIFRKDLIIGNKRALYKVLFNRGSSELSYSTNKALDKIAIKPHRFPKIQLEALWNICCTTSFQ